MRRASNNLLAGLECRTAWSEVSGVCGTLRFNQCQHVGAPAHRSSAYFRATKRRAAVSEQTATRKIPALQHSEGQAAHKSVTGAGDAFMGGLSFGMLQGWDLPSCGLFANGCAALCCTKVGARAMGRRTEVLALIKSQRPADASHF